VNHFALALLLPAALLTWRWSRLVSGALWLALAVWLAYRGVRWASPDTWAAGHLEWMRGVSMVTGLAGAAEIARRHGGYHATWHVPEDMRPRMAAAGLIRPPVSRPDYLAGLLVVSMGVDLAALLICRAWGQWGPQPFFQCIVLVAMCVVAWPRRKP
jgi:hypothetical protein